MSTLAPRVLVVDDDPSFRLLMSHVLGGAGIATAQAGPEQDVVALARRERPDLILLDWRMRGQSGLQICRRLRADGEVGGVPVVMLTGHSGERHRASALEAGASAMVTKGTSTRELVEVVRATAGATG